MHKPKLTIDRTLSIVVAIAAVLGIIFGWSAIQQASKANDLTRQSIDASLRSLITNVTESPSSGLPKDCVKTIRVLQSGTSVREEFRTIGPNGWIGYENLEIRCTDVAGRQPQKTTIYLSDDVHVATVGYE